MINNEGATGGTSFVTAAYMVDVLAFEKGDNALLAKFMMRLDPCPGHCLGYTSNSFGGQPKEHFQRGQS